MNNTDQQAPKVARVGNSYYELKATGHQRLPDGIDYVADIEGIAPSFRRMSLERALKPRKKNGGPNRKVKSRRKSKSKSKGNQG